VAKSKFDINQEEVIWMQHSGMLLNEAQTIGNRMTIQTNPIVTRQAQQIGYESIRLPVGALVADPVSFLLERLYRE